MTINCDIVIVCKYQSNTGLKIHSIKLLTDQTKFINIINGNVSINVYENANTIKYF